ncbi:MAG: hypothetical protein MN733_05360 [Nitrososphaera sp.]|nr:hypothetical protein [Nitrososphaera sp.]
MKDEKRVIIIVGDDGRLRYRIEGEDYLAGLGEALKEKVSGSRKKPCATLSPSTVSALER